MKRTKEATKKEDLSEKKERKEDLFMKTLITEQKGILDEKDEEVLEKVARAFIYDALSVNSSSCSLGDHLFGDLDDSYFERLKEQTLVSKVKNRLEQPPLEVVIEGIQRNYDSFTTMKSRASFREKVSQLVNSNQKDKTSLLFLMKMLAIFGHISESVLNEVRSSVENLSHGNNNYHKIIETTAAIPYNILKVGEQDLDKIKQELDKNIYGMEDVKDYILNILAISKASSKPITVPILLYGPPGVGKTVFASTLAKALGLPFYRINCNSSYDRASIKGSNRTWSNSDVGEITRILLKAQCVNPVIQFDEIDKAGGSSAGNFIDTILEIIDPEQRTFRDDFLSVTYDLSYVQIICTANDLDKVPSHILDRCEIIKIKQHTKEEKYKIIKDFMPRQIVSKCNLNLCIVIEDDVVEALTNIRSLRDIQRTILNTVGRRLRKSGQYQGINTIVLDDPKEIEIEQQVDDEKPAIGFCR